MAGTFGSANVTVTVSDGELTTTESFLLNVSEVVSNSAPTISEIEDQTIDQDTGTESLDFIVGDAETAADALTVSVESDNPALVDVAGIVVTGDGADKSLIITPLAGAFGTANITVNVSDGEFTTSESFLLTVNEVATGPTVVDDAFSTDADTPFSIDPAGVLLNDAGDTLTVTDVNGEAANVGTPVVLASGAEVTINADGSMSYDPAGKFASLAEGETAVETVSYTATDASAASATANVEVTVTGVNECPGSDRGYVRHRIRYRAHVDGSWRPGE